LEPNDAKWKCSKVKETDYRPEHEGISFQYLCKTDGETGNAYAIINPSRCEFVYLTTFPEHKGIGKTVEPLIEEELKYHGNCETIYALPKSTAGRKLLESTYWSPTHEWSKNI
jgi:hypothetical protein